MQLDVVDRRCGLFDVARVGDIDDDERVVVSPLHCPPDLILRQYIVWRGRRAYHEVRFAQVVVYCVKSYRRSAKLLGKGLGPPKGSIRHEHRFQFSFGEGDRHKCPQLTGTDAQNRLLVEGSHETFGQVDGGRADGD